jgi:hypothetical protein
MKAENDWGFIYQRQSLPFYSDDFPKIIPIAVPIKSPKGSLVQGIRKLEKIPVISKSKEDWIAYCQDIPDTIIRVMTIRSSSVYPTELPWGSVISVKLRTEGRLPIFTKFTLPEDDITLSR